MRGAASHFPSNYNSKNKTPIPKIVKETVRWKLLSKRETTRRSGHASTSIPNTPYFYTYGGSKENIGTPLEEQQLVVYDYDKGEWRDLTPLFLHSQQQQQQKQLQQLQQQQQHPRSPLSNCFVPYPRLTPTIVGVYDGREIGSEIIYQLDKGCQQHSQVKHSAFLLFGGWVAATSKPSNELWKYNTLTNTWHDLTSVQTGKIPSARSNHSCVVIDDKMIVFGGLGEKPEEILSDTYILDLKNLTWKEVAVEGEPGVDFPHKSRSHACAVHRKRMVLFGGGTDKIYYNKLWAFDLSVEKWFPVPVNEPKIFRELQKRQEEQRLRQATSFDLISEFRINPSAVLREPEPRLFCVGVVVDVDHFYIFGGRNGKQKINETWRFDFGVNEWTLLEFNNKNEVQKIFAPYPDDEEDENSDSENVFQNVEDVWSHDSVNKDTPSPRSGCTMSTITSAEGKTRILMFGGSLQKARSSELWELQIQSDQTKNNLLKALNRQVFVDVEIYSQ